MTARRRQGQIPTAWNRKSRYDHRVVITQHCQDDLFYAERITYLYRENSLYNRRYEQRRRMKELLGRRHRPLVERAKYKRHTKQMFLEGLTGDEAKAIRRIFHIGPGLFWRASRGKTFLALPPREIQLELPFAEDDR